MTLVSEKAIRLVPESVRPERGNARSQAIVAIDGQPFEGGVVVRNTEGSERSDIDGAAETIYSPEEIASRAGGINLKSLAELIRQKGLETTTLGYAPPSRKGGPSRRLWGMTTAQLDALLALRRRQRE